MLIGLLRCEHLELARSIRHAASCQTVVHTGCTPLIVEAREAQRFAQSLEFGAQLQPIHALPPMCRLTLAITCAPQAGADFARLQRP